jgi:3-hydroxybutyryl-CoA dehydrogenase
MLVAVVGAGATGCGIALVAAAAGHQVLVYDPEAEAADSAVGRARGRCTELTDGDPLGADPAGVSPTAVLSMRDVASAHVVVEAVAGDLTAKHRLFAYLEALVAPNCILATTSSTLSPTAIAAGLEYPGRVVGLHFVDPVTLTRLVEVVPGSDTDRSTVESVTALGIGWGMTVVCATAAPGLIVDRVARPFYAEAWRLYDEQVADAATIDAVLTGAAGFRAGPFASMDDLGHDVSEAVTRSIWTAFGHDPRFAPSQTQHALVEGGRLGRKSGQGCYDYASGARPPTPMSAPACPAPLEVVEHGASGMHGLLERSGVAVLEGDQDGDFVELPSGAMLVRCSGATATELAAEVGRPVVLVDRTLDDGAVTAVAIAVSENCPPAALAEATGLLQAAGLDIFVIDDVPGLIVARTVAMLVNFAVDALHHGVATPADIDTAMCLGANFPIGPLEWGQRWGARLVLAILDALLRAEGDPRYRASTLLRRRAAAGALLTR